MKMSEEKRGGEKGKVDLESMQRRKEKVTNGGEAREG